MVITLKRILILAILLKVPVLTANIYFTQRDVLSNKKEDQVQLIVATNKQHALFRSVQGSSFPLYPHDLIVFPSYGNEITFVQMQGLYNLLG